MSAPKKKPGCLGIIGIVAGVFIGGSALIGAVGTLLDGSSSESRANSFVSAEQSAPAALPEGDEAQVTSITDGDTLDTSLGTVRIIGIDTPEAGECGYDSAASLISSITPVGSTVRLVLPDGQNDRDKYDRLLRYVETIDGEDLGGDQIRAGHAVARYDSSDGYPSHPRESEYAASQVAQLSPDGRVITTECAAQADLAAQAQAEAERLAADKAAAAAAAAQAVEAWWTQYSSCSKLKKNGVGHPTGPFNVNDPAQTEIYNWFEYGTGHRGDGDGDGWACE